MIGFQKFAEFSSAKESVMIERFSLMQKKILEKNKKEIAFGQCKIKSGSNSRNFKFVYILFPKIS